ncbi:MAG: DUF3461 family protein [Pseudomonadota bacterium]
MSQYPQLNDMGILNPSEIRTYMVNSLAGVDTLRIVYKRKEGSLLPVSRSYEFPQVQKTATDGKGRKADVLETAPSLKSALSELKSLMKAREDETEHRELLLSELDALENELACRIAHIRSLL